MIKKIIILVLVVWGLVFFYRHFVAGTTAPFFKSHKTSFEYHSNPTPSLEKVPD
ncbi:MAG: hypothetical protein GF375_06510 [Candidatus Omnitrophica bacterium]|nr:hypothetical protein [Candidatus Omnitrophota bacterium]MBD3269626.1 hypothetical protein [Candidatus Omnitrophota bacterium]